MGYELGGKRAGVGLGVVLRMCVDGRKSRYARTRYLGICWCRGWTRLAVKAILRNYLPHSHSFHFLLTCVPGGLNNSLSIYLSIFPWGIFSLACHRVSWAGLSWLQSPELISFPKPCSSMLARRDEWAWGEELERVRAKLSPASFWACWWCKYCTALSARRHSVRVKFHKQHHLSSARVDLTQDLWDGTGQSHGDLL